MQERPRDACPVRWPDVAMYDSTITRTQLYHDFCKQ